MRTCIGCNSKASKNDLLRLVISDKRVSIDKTGGQAGRGAYLCVKETCLETALKRNRLARSLRTKISEDTPAELRSVFKELLDEQKVL